jgi:hypothetical protein
MIKKLTAVLAAFAFALTTLAPAVADARDHRRDGWYDGRHYRDYDRRHWRDHDDDDEVAAGVVGLVLGLAIGSMASQPREPRYGGCYDRCAPPPPPRCYDRCGYERERYYDRRYDDRGAYERDYDLDGGPDGYYERERCTRSERQWDRYADRYVVVDVPC